jgi:hypothetical protein
MIESEALWACLHLRVRVCVSVCVWRCGRYGCLTWGTQASATTRSSPPACSSASRRAEQPKGDASPDLPLAVVAPCFWRKWWLCCCCDCVIMLPRGRLASAGCSRPSSQRLAGGRHQRQPRHHVPDGRTSVSEGRHLPHGLPDILAPQGHLLWSAYRYHLQSQRHRLPATRSLHPRGREPGPRIALRVPLHTLFPCRAMHSRCELVGALNQWSMFGKARTQAQARMQACTRMQDLPM